METILFLAHTEADGRWRSPRWKRLAPLLSWQPRWPARRWSVGLCGAQVAPAADQLANCGAAKFLGVAGAEFAQARYATDAAAVEALGRAAQATIVVSADTSRLARVLPGVAHRLGGRVDTHVNSIQVEGGAMRVTRWFYRQRMEAELARTQRPWLLALDPGCHAAYQGAPGKASAELIPVALTDSHARTTVSGLRSPGTTQQTIRPDAKLLFVAGAGWTKKQKDGQTHAKEAEQLILGFLDCSQASLGSSKSLVDLSGEGQAVLAVHDAPEPGRPDRLDAAPSQGPLHLLSRRRTARGGLAVHQRTPRHQSRPQLRLGARQGRRALRGRCLRGDAQGERTVGREVASAMAARSRKLPQVSQPQAITWGHPESVAASVVEGSHAFRAQRRIMML